MMELTFASWNINGRGACERQLVWLADLDADIVVLQEVTRAAYGGLLQMEEYTSSCCSLQLRPPRTRETRKRALGCAILCREPYRLLTVSLLEDSPAPERTLVAMVVADDVGIAVGSFHIPPGVSWGERRKVRACKAAGAWMAQQSRPTLVGIDANCPHTDHPDHTQNIWWNDGEEHLLGATPCHHLHDALRSYLAAHPKALARVRAERPEGPLAISHRRGHTVPCRYDFVYATPNIGVRQVRYLYDEALAAGSDHALVLAKVRFSPG